MTWVIPFDLVAPLGWMEVAGQRYRVPAQVEDYLDYRYGDWRTPVEEWCYWEDDGAIRRQRPGAVEAQLLGRGGPSID